MNPVPASQFPIPAARLALIAGLFAAVLLAVRITGLVLYPSALHADETQYWIWSRNVDWGYFSKPPLIAWIIAASTSVFGNADWAVRLPAPILHTITATFLALSANRLFGPVTAFWSFIVWLTLPAVWLSAAVMTTDSALLMFWSASLYAFIRLRDGGGWISALGVGAGIGLGIMAKYAMSYFIAGLVLAAILDPVSRRALLQIRTLAAAALAFLIVLPNLIWNWRNDFATLSHTAANANWDEDLINPGHAISFVLDQLGVFGPVLFPVLVVVLVWTARRWLSGQADARLVMLASFCAPAIIVVTSQAFLSRSHAGWAASAYAAGTLIVVALLMEGPRWRRWLVAGSVAVHTIAGLSMATLALSPALTEQVGMANAFKRVRGWPETAERLAEAVERTGVEAIVFDNRNDFHQMQRYGTGIDAELYMWVRYSGISSHAELGWSLPAGFTGPVLIASERPIEVPVLALDFARMDPQGEIRVDLGGRRERVYQLFLAQDYRPALRTQAFEDAIWQAREADAQ
ncbi:MAG: hypothetical protein HLUCCA04_07335 [Oceanicaulis sp. HLUCCA04]|nr:MAG: hypothetical protein HLUCCA04_07335 [Oceanicaulis sp. HLUCCA04]